MKELVIWTQTRPLFRRFSILKTRPKEQVLKDAKIAVIDGATVAIKETIATVAMVPPLGKFWTTKFLKDMQNLKLNGLAKLSFHGL